MAAGILVLGLAFGGCASFQPKPLVPRDVLRDLQRVRLEALRPAVPAGSSSSEAPGPPVFDLSDGLSADEAVAVALFLNPGIRAARRERGVADGELIASRVLPNPELQVTWLHIENFTKSLATSGFDVGLSWSPPRPGELDAKTGRAQARLEEVRAQIADEEWKLAAEVRKAHAALWAATERLRLADVSVTLQGRVRQFMRDKRETGDASRLEVNLLELEYAERVREREAIASEHRRARLELNRLLGVPPAVDIPLDARADVLAYRPFALKPAVLESVMVDRRPELAAARQEYEQAQQQLRLAYIQRIPWFRFGPAYERDGGPGEGSINKLGLGLMFEIPLSNLNEGELVRLEAGRDKLRDAFSARVHAARAEVQEAHERLLAQQRLVQVFEDSVRPALEENAALTDAAVELGDVNVLQFVTAQDKVLRGRREFVDARLEYWKAAFDLERALGARLGEVERKEE
jgi:cobalt-zinc-cadmium efflux system outer membrane protein